MSDAAIDRRRFLTRTAAGAGALTALAGCVEEPGPPRPAVPPVPDAAAADPAPEPAGPRLPYRGPNVILVRFGGGVRRRETIRPDLETYCPFIFRELAGNRGTLFNRMEIVSAPGIATSHGQGTLYLLTGRYEHYEDVHRQFLAERFEAKVPTLFEYLRQKYDVPAHQTLLINGEDRINEEFYTFSNHHSFGVRYRSTVLSLYRFKSYLLREELKDQTLPEAERRAKRKQLDEMEKKDYRRVDASVSSPELDAFWAEWRDYYGRSGLVNPRGDRLLTELALRALAPGSLRPRLMMINYQDPDYVHWGPPSFYTRAISVIDDGVRQLYQAVRADPEYRDNTVFLIVPDCGRDDSRGTAVPFQHHFNSKSAHEVFLIATGPGVARGRVVDRPCSQTDVTATAAAIMQFTARHADASVLKEVFE